MKYRFFSEQNLLTLSIFVLISVSVVVGCDDGRLLGKDVYFEGEKCNFVYDDERIDLSCGPLSKIDSMETGKTYFGSVQNIDEVHDGDTITNVYIPIHFHEDGAGQVDTQTFPGVEFRKDAIYIIENVRLNNLDAAEVRRSTNYPAEERNLAKARGFISRNYLRSLVEQSVIDGVPLSMEIIPYGRDGRGRLIADVILYINGQRVDVGPRMRETRHAVAYIEGVNFQWGLDPLDFTGWYEMLGIEDPYIQPADGSEHPFEGLFEDFTEDDFEDFFDQQ